MIQTPTAPVLPADDMALVPIKSIRPIVGLGNSAIYDKGSKGAFPLPLRLSPRCSRFRAGDVRAWLADPTGWHPSRALDWKESLS